MMRQIGLELVAVDTQAGNRASHYVLTYGDGSE